MIYGLYLSCCGANCRVKRSKVLVRTQLFPPLNNLEGQFSTVESLSHVWLFMTPWTAGCQSSVSITNSLNQWCPLSRWCQPTISSSVIPFSSCLQFFQASGSFQMSQFFTSGDQSVAVSASASVLPMNSQDWFPLGWTGWISLQSKGLSRVFSNTTVQKHQFFSAQPSLQSNSHTHTWLLEKPVLTRRTFVGKVMSLFFNKLSRLAITFLPRNKRLLISWLQSPSAVIFGAQKSKVWHRFHCFPIYFPWSDGTRCHDLRLLNVEL